MKFSSSTRHRNRQWKYWVGSALALSIQTCAWPLTAIGQESDPTQPSAALLQQLRPNPKATTGGSKPQATDQPEFRLRAIVMRNMQSGVALVSSNRSHDSDRLYRIDLTPESLDADQPVLEIGGIQYFLQDYHPAGLRIRQADSSRAITIQ